MIVTIDGTAASGKSTTAREVARRLGFTYLNTGATYRALALYLKEKGIDYENEEAVKKILNKVDINLIGEKVILNGRDVSSLIYSEEISKISSKIATYKSVREFLVDIQRKIGARGNVIAEGRDTGTVVFPNADIKIYMDADITERAKRRKRDLEKLGKNLTIEEVIESLRKRDEQDSKRKYSPLKKPTDAVEIDTTNLTIEEEIQKVINIIKQHESSV